MGMTRLVTLKSSENSSDISVNDGPKSCILLVTTPSSSHRFIIYFITVDMNKGHFKSVQRPNFKMLHLLRPAVGQGAGFIVERLRESKHYKTSQKEADTVHVSLIKPLQKTKPETNIKQSI
jgi:hypothetical protein